MTYDLRHFNKTWFGRANQNSQTILNKWPYLCSREALVNALAATTYDGPANPRNPNGYTAAQMADKIIELFDEIMYATWFDNTVYHPQSLIGAINSGLRWDQVDFWSNFGTHFIYHNGNGAGVGMYVLDNVLNENIVILPQTSYTVNTAEFFRKPYLGFDFNMMKSTFGAELDLVNPGVDGRVDGLNGGFGLTNALISAGSFVVGVEYNIREVGDTDFTLIGASQNVVNTVFTATGSGSGTGKARETSGVITSDLDNPIPVNDIHPSLLFIYNNTYFHPDLQPQGFNLSVWDGALPGDWFSFPSSKRFDKSIAEFDVTVSGGVVTAITGVARNDGDGVPVTGGWGYTTANDYQELTFYDPIAATNATQIAPRILIRANADQVGYTGNKATVNIADATSEFYPGKNLQNGTWTAYAIYGVGGKGEVVDPDIGVLFDDYFDINLPTTVLPGSVRVITERPILKSTTRSLKEIRVGTGAHRIGFEFEYPPMTQSEARPFIDFFEQAKGGANAVQISVPKRVMSHTESVFYNVPVSTVANRSKILSGGTLGSDTMILDGFGPGKTIPDGTYFQVVNHTKLYRTLECSNADDYGRVETRFEPPLVLSSVGQTIRMRNTNQSRSDFFLMKAYLVDDVLDYTVDAAGLYRIRFKFVEVL